MDGKTSTTGEATDSMEPLDPETCPYGCCEVQSLPEFILNEGLFKGACSDITLRAFDSEYKLHKLILSQSGYFHSLFTGPWSDTDESVHELVFDHDSFITKEAFDLAIGSLYGATRVKANTSTTPLNVIAIAQYLDIPHLVCSATDMVVNAMDFKTVAQFTSFALHNNYGKASERIVDCAKGFLCSNGWQSGVKSWDGIPVKVIASVLGADCFFVPSEWDRAIFIIRLIQRRKMVSKSEEDEEDDDLEALFQTLNNKVYYCHLTAEQLHKLEGMVDGEGEPFIYPEVLRNALWQKVHLQGKVASADNKSQELGLSVTSDIAPDGVTSWFIPSKNETLYGTPAVLESTIKETHQIIKNLPSGKTTEKHTNDGVSSSAESTAASVSEVQYQVTKIPPFRFSIAFSGVSELEADKRVYAKTLWYAGSYWNLYIQKIRHRKGYQMGVYIHRASSCAPSRSGLLNKDVLDPSMLVNIDDLNEYDGDYHEKIDNILVDLANVGISRNGAESSSSLTSTVISGRLSTDGVETEEDNIRERDTDSSFLSYEDDRVKTSVYYIIYTPSRKVTSSLTCFISTPDLFNKSQSWGWKSSSMCAFNEDGTLAEGQDKLLKFMVVLGNT